MSVVFPAVSIVSSSYPNRLKVYELKSRGSASLNPYYHYVHRKAPWTLEENASTSCRSNPCVILKSTYRKSMKKHNYQSYNEEITISSGQEDQGDDLEEMSSPWEGAVVYKRNPLASHVEYCTTLERLGLGKLSTEVSKSRASEMGLRITKDVKDYPHGTPVQISIDVTRKKQKLRLDGIIRTVISLSCNRCGEPAAECIFSNFSLLLKEEHVEEPDVIDMGVIFGVDKVKTYKGFSEEDEDDEDSMIDLEDQLYFPPEEKIIDISKNIRDMVHLEITISLVCDPMCKGLCLKCGTNLNNSSCSCIEVESERKQQYGPLANLKKQMHPPN